MPPSKLVNLALSQMVIWHSAQPVPVQHTAMVPISSRLRNVPQEKIVYKLEILPSTVQEASTLREVFLIPQASVVVLVMFVPIQEQLDHSRFLVRRANSSALVVMESLAQLPEMVSQLREVNSRKEFVLKVSTAITQSPNSLLLVLKVPMELQLVLTVLHNVANVQQAKPVRCQD